MNGMYTKYTLYEGLDSINKNDRKLDVFGRKSSGNCFLVDLT